MAGVERVLGIARGLGVDPSVGGDGDRDDARLFSASDLARAREEARAWLEAARAWEERLELNFRGYRDLTEPLRLSVCEMRRGVALALASAPDPADDADVGVCKTIYFVRHAEGSHNRDSREIPDFSERLTETAAYIDSPLTPVGIEQCAKLATAVATIEPVELVAVSPLRTVSQSSLLP